MNLHRPDETKVLIDGLTAKGSPGISFNGEAHPLAMEVMNTFRMDEHHYDEDPLLHYGVRQTLIALRKKPDATGLLLHGIFPRGATTQTLLTVTIECNRESGVAYCHYIRRSGSTPIVSDTDPVELIIRWGDTSRSSMNLFVDSLDGLKYRWPHLDV
jgi:hypothetical protein